MAALDCDLTVSKGWISILEVDGFRLRSITQDSLIKDPIIGDEKVNGGDEIIGATRRWLERSVIGLGLCPFAESVYKSQRVRFCVSRERFAPALLKELRAELLLLRRQDPNVCETTLLIHPWALGDFVEYNDFLEVCDAALAELGLVGELQIASFHPQYQFAGTQASDIENHTNRSPYPMLHLLREASIERALAGVADPKEIYRRNVRTLRALGHEGWQALWKD